MGKLPIHGFVLAGGQSRRMGRDKALLEFRGRPLVEIAVERLRSFCSKVSIAGNRDDLARFAPVVRETRIDVGPLAGVEAGLLACGEPWSIFTPVDVPLVPAELLRRWVEALMNREAEAEGTRWEHDPVYGSTLTAGGRRQPAFQLMRSHMAVEVSRLLDRGERRLEGGVQELQRLAGSYCFAMDEAAAFAPVIRPTSLELEYWFSNVNTPQEFEIAALWAETVEREGGILKGRTL